MKVSGISKRTRETGEAPKFGEMAHSMRVIGARTRQTGEGV